MSPHDNDDKDKEQTAPVERAEPPAAPAASESPAHAQPVRSGISGGGAFALGLVASVLVLGTAAGGAYVTMPQWQPKLAERMMPREAIAGAQAAATQAQQQAAAVDGKLAQVGEALVGLRSQLATIEKAIPAAAGGAAVDPARVEALATRIAALETLPRFDPAQLAALRQTLDGLAGELATLRKEMTAFNGLGTELKQANAEFKQDFKQAWTEFKETAVAPSQVLKLTERIDAAEAAVQQAQSRSQQAQALLIATGQLREAIYRGTPFEAELRSLKLIAGNDEQMVKPLAALEGLAGKGVATRGELTSRFGELASDMIRAEVAPQEGGWWHQTVQAVTSVITIRRLDGEAAGDSVSARVARAADALDKGDLAGAVRELSGLGGGPAQVAAPWLAKAQARLAAEQALSNVTAHAVAVAQAKG